MSVTNSDPPLLPPPPPPSARDRSFSITTNSQALFTSDSSASSSRLPVPGDLARRLSVAKPPLSIEEFAIPDPFVTQSSPSAVGTLSSGAFGAGSAFPVTHIGGGSAAMNSAGRQVVWPRRSRESSPVRSRPTSRPSSRPGSRPSSVLGLNRDPHPSQSPRLWVAALCNPALFLEIPNSDPLQTLLNKHLPPASRPTRDTHGEYAGRTIEEMVESGSWRSLAVYARDGVVKADPGDLGLILQLWLLRLHSLHHLLLPSQATSELLSLFSTIQSLSSSRSGLTPALLAQNMPFELEVMWARRKSWLPAPSLSKGSPVGQSEKDLVGAVEDLGDLFARCKRIARKARKSSKEREAPLTGLGVPLGEDNKDLGSASVVPEDKEIVAERSMWTDRAVRVAIVMSSVLIDLKEPLTAISLLDPLLSSSSSSSLYLVLISLHLSLGDLPSARVLLETLLSSSVPDGAKYLGKALVASGYGNWGMVIDTLSPALEGAGVGSKAERMVLNNAMAVALLNKGDLEGAVKVLQGDVVNGAKQVYNEPMLFNLTTLYELQSGSSTQKKVDLLLKTVAAIGDGLRPGCLKLS